MSTTGARAGATLRAGWRRLVALPLAARLAALTVAVALGFLAVVVPLFAGGGSPRAELGGFLPTTVAAGQRVRVDIALDNVGDSVIYPVCVALSGRGARLLSANFQGLDQVSADANRACGGQLTGQETISVTLVFTVAGHGSMQLRLVPEQGSTAIGPVLTGTITVS